MSMSRTRRIGKRICLVFYKPTCTILYGFEGELELPLCESKKKTKRLISIAHEREVIIGSHHGIKMELRIQPLCITRGLGNV